MWVGGGEGREVEGMVLSFFWGGGCSDSGSVIEGMAIVKMQEFGLGGGV